jgi:hypothetical protein
VRQLDHRVASVQPGIHRVLEERNLDRLVARAELVSRQQHVRQGQQQAQAKPRELARIFRLFRPKGR